MAQTQSVRVSYIISTRDRAEFLDRALDNVREFITPDDELIVMDGGSTDHTAEVIEKHRDIVTLFKSEPDFGEAHGFNKGILESKGRYIKLLSDDDYTYPEAMRYAISVMENHPELDAILCGGESYYYDPVTHESRFNAYLWLPPSHRLTADVRNIFDYVSCGLGLILTRRVVGRVGLLDTTFRAVDTDYMSRLIACQVNFRYLNIKLFHHKVHPHSGQSNWPECRRDRLRALLRNRAWVEMMDRRRYPPSAVGEVLGLSDLPGGDSLAHIIWYAERLRRSRVYPILPLLVRGLEGCTRIKGWYNSQMRRVRRKVRPSRVAASPSKAQPPIEPVWDGSLR